MHVSVHLSKAVVVDEIRSVSVNQSVEGEAVLPAEGEKTHLNNGRHGRKCCSLIKGTSIIKPVNDVVYLIIYLILLKKKHENTLQLSNRGRHAPTNATLNLSVQTKQKYYLLTHDLLLLSVNTENHSLIVN